MCFIYANMHTYTHIHILNSKLRWSSRKTRFSPSCWAGSRGKYLIKAKRNDSRGNFLSNREEHSRKHSLVLLLSAFKNRENNAFFSHNIICRSHSLAREVILYIKLTGCLHLKSFQNFLLQEFVSKQIESEIVRRIEIWPTKSVQLEKILMPNLSDFRQRAWELCNQKVSSDIKPDKTSIGMEQRGTQDFTGLRFQERICLKQGRDRH